MSHLVVAVLVVVLVNTQLTWWIIFVLRENRTRLSLERQTLQARCEGAAHALLETLLETQRNFSESVERGPDLSEAPPPPCAEWRLTPAADWCGTIRLHEGEAVLSARQPASDECVVGTAAPGWAAELLEVDTGLEVVRASSIDLSDRRAAAVLPPPFSDHVVRPDRESWSDLLDGYRRRILMMVTEGAFFAAMLFVLVALLWRTLRRELALEQQHRNFLSAITHELKSPLASMRLSLETVLRGRADPSASVRFLENALQDTERLQSLVEKVLEVTRYAHVGGGIKLREANISEVIEGAVDRFSRRATAAGVNLKVAVEPDVWGLIDEEALSIVISNLLENALKYGGTPPRIDVTFRLDAKMAIIEVGDNGNGIAEADIPLVFERFWRSGDEMTRTTEGTGLGLYLVKQIVDGHKGSVRITTTGPTGTTFRVILAAYDAEEGP